MSTSRTTAPTTRLGAAVAVLLALAVLVAALQAITPDRAGAAEERVSPRIPAGFPLDAGLTDWGPEGFRRGPSNQVKGLPLDPCGEASWKPQRWVARMAVRNYFAESLDVRELVTFSSASRAVRVMAGIRADLRTCPRLTGEPGARTTVHRYGFTTGYDDVLWSLTQRNGSIGGYVAQLTRVGSAILLNYNAGDYVGRPVGGARQMNRDSREFAPRMCRWTAAGC